MNKFNIASKNKLDNPDRREQFPPVETLKKLGLKENMDMADIGTGIGYFSLPATEIVGKDSKVYALDTAREMLDEVKARSKGENNLELVETEEYDFKLADASVDFVLMVNVLHEVEDKLRFLEEVKRISRESAEFALIDFKEKRINNQGPPEEIRVSQDKAVELLQSVGYEILERIDFGGSFYGLRARKID